MHVFVGYRPTPPSVRNLVVEYLANGTAAPADQPQYEGMVCEDGTVMVRWRTAYRSSSVFSSWEDFLAVHGHPEYGTRIEWYHLENMGQAGAPWFALDPCDRAAIERQEMEAASGGPFGTMGPGGE